MDESRTLDRRVSVALSDGPLATADASKHHGAGAMLVFHGDVRPLEDGKPLTGLVYTAYEPMTQRQLVRIAEEAVARFGLLFVGVEHSRGFVAVGETSLRLTIASAHRKPGIQALDMILDALKQDVPIWKRPRFVDEQEPGR